jgi:UDP-N-acetylmuramoyl-L-alanyl-D-glutamate--2,6-diaminopimelate ligase
VPAVGEVFAENALAAYLAAVAAGIEPATAADAISRAAPPPGRFQVVSHNPYVVVDYAHTPDALARTLLAARRLCRGELTVVFGAGGERDTTKRAAMGASASACDRVVLTSDNPRGEDPARIVEQIAWGIADGVSVDVELDRRSAIARAIGRAGPHDVIVVAGRGHETEQLVGTIRMHLSDVDVARAAARFERPSRPSS